MIEVSGKSILFMDYSNVGPADLDAILTAGRSIIDKAEPKSILLLSDFTDVTYDRESSNRMKDFSKQNTPFIKASAVVGITGLKKVIYKGVVRASGRNIQLCETIEDGQKWLASQ